jgi:hypothetical protein
MIHTHHRLESGTDNNDKCSLNSYYHIGQVLKVLIGSYSDWPLLISI